MLGGNGRRSGVMCEGSPYSTLPLNISVLLPEQSQESRRTLNVVYKEVFNSIRL